MMHERYPTMDRHGLLKLEPDECQGMLGSTAVGRLVFLDGDQPIALPVTYTLFEGDVVFHTAPGSKLDAARRSGARVAFEADEYDPSDRIGWSVLVKGTMELVTDSHQLLQLEQLSLHPWADEVERRRWIRVRREEVSGRCIMPRRLDEHDGPLKRGSHRGKQLSSRRAHPSQI